MRAGAWSRWGRAVLCILAVVATTAPAGIIYVDDDAPGLGDGSAWQTACKHLQDALKIAAAAAKPVEIRVAGGVYKPDQGVGLTPGDQTVAFQLLNGVAIIGGYAGVGASDPDARDVDLYETILSGDLAGNGSGDFPSAQDDSCRVVVGSLTDSTAVMDGFTVAGGNWRSMPCGFPSESTARVFIDAGSPTIRSCRFLGIRSSGSVGAVSLRNGSAPNLTDCVFVDSHTGLSSVASSPILLHCTFVGYWTAMDCTGGGAPSCQDCRFESGTTGIENSGGASLTLADCTFVDNFTGLAAWSGMVTATNCVFEDNRKAIGVLSGSLRAVGCGFQGNTNGAVEGGGDINLARCSFTGNSGGIAAGITTVGSTMASDCAFTGNSGGSVGAILGGRILDLRKCEFNGNTGQVAGAVDADGDVLKATGCLFAGNSGRHTGALYSGAALFLLSNCTFVENRGVVNAIRYDKPGSACPASMTQCILRDGPAAILEESPEAGPMVVAYSNVLGGHPGKGNFDADPCFVAPGHWVDPNDPSLVLGRDDPDAVWVPGDYHLKSQAGHWDRESADWVLDEVTSPCIDAGDPNGPLGAEPFPNGGVVNVGAYGGTAEASRSYFGGPVCERQIPGDINGDCVVNDTDMEILTSHWLMQGWPGSDLPPVVAITEPKEGAEFHDAAPIPIRAEAADPDGVVIRVLFHMEYRLETSTGTTGRGTGFVDADPSDGWGREWQWASQVGKGSAQIWTIWAEAMDNDGNITTSPRIKVTLHGAN